MRTFEAAGVSYELKFNLKRIELIESVTAMPTMAVLQMYKGMMSLQQLKIYLGYAIKEAGDDVFVAPKKGMEMAEELIRENGYTEVCTLVLEALQEDCPFFFLAD